MSLAHHSSSQRWNGSREGSPPLSPAIRALASPSLVTLTRPRPSSSPRTGVSSTSRSARGGGGGRATVGSNHGLSFSLAGLGSPSSPTPLAASSISAAHGIQFGVSARFPGPPPPRPQPTTTYTPSGRRVLLGQSDSATPSRSPSPRLRRRHFPRDADEYGSVRTDLDSVGVDDDDDNDGVGPRASDYAATRSSLEAMHARNTAAKAAAQARADAAQAQLKANQEAVTSACSALTQGLEDAEDTFDERLDEYDALLAHRTEVARALHLQLRKQSRYNGGGGGGGGGPGASAETVDSLLDAVSTWFTARSTRARSDEPVLAEREADAENEAERVAAAGGAEGAIAALLARAHLTPAMQARLIARMRDAATETIAAEAEAAAATHAALEAARTRIAEDAQRMKALEDALEKASAGGGAPGTNGTSGTKGVRGSIIGGGVSGTGGNVLLDDATKKRVAELEALLKKKIRLASDLEKKRAKLVGQVSTLSRACVEKDRALEVAHNAAERMTLELAATTLPMNATRPGALGAGGDPSEHRDALTQQLMLRSSQQAEELGALKLFVAHASWEREAFVRDAFRRDADAQVQRVRECFERLMSGGGATSSSSVPGAPGPDSHSLSTSNSDTSAETLAPEHLQRVLRVGAQGGIFVGAFIPKEFELFVHALDAARPSADLRTYLARNLAARSGQLVELGEEGVHGLGPELSSIPSSPAAPTPRKPASVLFPSVHIGFAQFFSVVLRHHPYERWLEHRRLATRLRLVFDGLDHDRDGVLSADEFASACRKEALGAPAEQLDAAYLTMTAPPPSLGAAMRGGVGGKSPRFLRTPRAANESAVVDSPTAAAEVLDSHVSRPLTFAVFLGLFRVDVLRALFESADAMVAAGSGPLGEQDSNAAIRRHARWTAASARARMQAERREREAAAAAAAFTPKKSPTGARAKGRGKTAANAAAAAAAAAALEVEDAFDVDDGDGDGGDAEAEARLLDAAPFFTGGTREVLQHLLLAHDADDHAAAASPSGTGGEATAPAEYISMAVFDARVEGAMRAGRVPGPRAPFIERALTTLCRPLTSVRAMLAEAAIASASTTGVGVASPGKSSLARRRTLASGEEVAMAVSAAAGTVASPLHDDTLLASHTSGGGTRRRGGANRKSLASAQGLFSATSGGAGGGATPSESEAPVSPSSMLSVNTAIANASSSGGVKPTHERRKTALDSPNRRVGGAPRQTGSRGPSASSQGSSGGGAKLKLPSSPRNARAASANSNSAGSTRRNAANATDEKEAPPSPTSPVAPWLHSEHAIPVGSHARSSSMMMPISVDVKTSNPASSSAHDGAVRHRRPGARSRKAVSLSPALAGPLAAAAKAERDRLVRRERAAAGLPSEEDEDEEQDDDEDDGRDHSDDDTRGPALRVTLSPAGEEGGDIALLSPRDDDGDDFAFGDSRPLSGQNLSPLSIRRRLHAAAEEGVLPPSSPRAASARHHPNTPPTPRRTTTHEAAVQTEDDEQRALEERETAKALGLRYLTLRDAEAKENASPLTSSSELHSDPDFRSLRRLYEDECARTTQLERALHLLSKLKDETGGPSAASSFALHRGNSATTPRHIHASPGGSMTSRGLGPSAGRERLSFPSTRPGSALVQLAAPGSGGDVYGELVSRRGDGMRDRLLPPRAFLFPRPTPPAAAAAHPPPPPHSRDRLRPQTDL